MHETGLNPALQATSAPLPSVVQRAGRRSGWLGATLLAGLAACASLPPAFAELDWADHWGDRGRGVLARDFGMCGELVESRRSQFADCMTARGWTIRR